MKLSPRALTPHAPVHPRALTPHAPAHPLHASARSSRTPNWTKEIDIKQYLSD